VYFVVLKRRKKFQLSLDQCFNDVKKTREVLVKTSITTQCLFQVNSLKMDLVLFVAKEKNNRENKKLGIGFLGSGPSGPNGVAKQETAH
jgi:hypothetical protein